MYPYFFDFIISTKPWKTFFKKSLCDVDECRNGFLRARNFCVTNKIGEGLEDQLVFLQVNNCNIRFFTIHKKLLS